jgi:hypothetical protein
VASFEEVVEVVGIVGVVGIVQLVGIVELVGFVGVVGIVGFLSIIVHGRRRGRDDCVSSGRRRHRGFAVWTSRSYDIENKLRDMSAPELSREESFLTCCKATRMSQTH